jgi:hypothetical protein
MRDTHMRSLSLRRLDGGPCDHSLVCCATYAVLCSLALQGEWILVLINLPLLGWHIKRYSGRPTMREPGIYDPTIAFNRNELSHNQSECCYKLGFYLLCFFYYLYKMMFALLSKEKEVWKHNEK